MNIYGPMTLKNKQKNRKNIMKANHFILLGVHLPGMFLVK